MTVYAGSDSMEEGMESELELNPEMSSPRGLVLRALRLHPFVTLLVVGGSPEPGRGRRRLSRAR